MSMCARLMNGHNNSMIPWMHQQNTYVGYKFIQMLITFHIERGSSLVEELQGFMDVWTA